MTYKGYILDCLIDGDEALTQIIEYFIFNINVNVSSSIIKKILAEMVEEDYIFINYSWKNEHDKYPYSLTEKGKKAWNEIE